MRTYCELCGKKLINPSSASKYCPECAAIKKVESDRERYAAIRSKKLAERVAKKREQKTSIPPCEEKRIRKLLQEDLQLDDFYFELFTRMKKEQYYRSINRRAEVLKSGKEMRMSKTITLIFDSEREG